MLRLYGYIGLALIAFAAANFYLVIQPFAEWYIPIVWYGFILFVDSLVYRVKKKSLISSYPKEFVFILVISVPFWLIFEVYNLFTHSWYYVNYLWYVHLANFTIILPAILETVSLVGALEIGKNLDRKRRTLLIKLYSGLDSRSSFAAIWLLVPIGALAVLLPFVVPAAIGVAAMFIGLFLLFDPLNYIMRKPSIMQKIASGKRSVVLQLILAGLIVGFFWELFNYMAYPKWIYTLSPAFMPNLKLFQMPVLGYLGYIPFAAEALAFYVFVRGFVFKKDNVLLLSD